MKTDKEMREHITKLLDAYRRRIETLEMVSKGKLELTRVDVRSYTVRTYRVRAHTRLIAPRRGTVATKGRKSP